MEKTVEGYPVYGNPVVYDEEPQFPIPDGFVAKNIFIGEWEWRHDGQIPNGDIVIKEDGVIGHKCGWSGGKWKKLSHNMIELQFNGILHQMVLDNSGNNLILIEPMRYPPSVAVRKGEDFNLQEIDLQHIATVKSEFSVNGGGTGAEYPVNLVKPGEEPWNKWYGTDKGSCWHQLTFKGPIIFKGFGLKSANDCPHRDPTSAELFIFDEKFGKWASIFKVDFNYSQRWQTFKWKVPQSTTRAITVQLRNNGNEMQLGQIRLYN